jgi:hypothetical protein
MATNQVPQEAAVESSGVSSVWSGPLEAPEQILLDFVETGDLLEFPAQTGDQTPVDFESMSAWGVDRTIRAGMLRHLLVASQWPVDLKGVRLRGARIVGNLDLESATLRCPLDLQDCYFERPIILDYASISLLKLVHCRLPGLTASLLRVNKELDLSQSKITGALRLPGASITGQLTCTCTQITGTDTAGNALIADRVVVGGDVLLNDGFTAVGAVQLSGAQIEGSLRLDGAELNGTVALVADVVRIGQQLVWAPKTAVIGRVSLQGTKVDRLDDDWGSHQELKPEAHWPGAGKLRLAGFVYNGFSGDHPATSSQRLHWIQSQHQVPLRGKGDKPGRPGRFDAQPYEHLAHVYRQAGQDTQARQIAIAKCRDLRTYGSLGLGEHVWNVLLDLISRHGYRPVRAVFMLMAVLATAVLLFSGTQEGLMVPVKDTNSLHPAPTTAACTPSYPCFSPIGYAIDVTIPIFKTGQAEYWRPAASAPFGYAYLYAAWFLHGLGWVFTAFAVAGYTGLINAIGRRAGPDAIP